MGKNTTRKIGGALVGYHKDLFLVGNATRRKTFRQRTAEPDIYKFHWVSVWGTPLIPTQFTTCDTSRTPWISRDLGPHGHQPGPVLACERTHNLRLQISLGTEGYGERWGQEDIDFARAGCSWRLRRPFPATATSLTPMQSVGCAGKQRMEMRATRLG